MLPQKTPLNAFFNTHIIIQLKKAFSSEKIDEICIDCWFVNDVLQNQKTSPLIRKAFKKSEGDFQLRGRIGKLLYLLL